MPEDTYHSTNGPNCLFAHEPSRLIIDCFPRSGSTVVLSNLALHSLGIQTHYQTNNVNQMRSRLHPSKPLDHYKYSVLLVREPLDRLESFFLTKLCRGEPKSIIAFLSLVFPGLAVLTEPHIAKIFKPFFFKQVSLQTLANSTPLSLSPSLLHLIAEASNFLDQLTFVDFLEFLGTHGFPRDKHLTLQSQLKSFRLSEYTALFTTDDFSCFSDYYSRITRCNFDFKYNQTQPNNRLQFKTMHVSSHLSLAELQSLLHKSITPERYSLYCSTSLSLATKLLSDDVQLFSSIPSHRRPTYT